MQHFYCVMIVTNGDPVFLLLLCMALGHTVYCTYEPFSHPNVNRIETYVSVCQERERRRQHMMLMKAVEARKKAEVGNDLCAQGLLLFMCYTVLLCFLSLSNFM